MNDMDKEMHHTQCPHGGYKEKIDLTVEPWATLAPLCWDNPSAFRLGWAAEEHGVKQNPFKSEFTRGVFEAGRQRCREAGTSNTKPMPQAWASELNWRLGVTGHTERIDMSTELKQEEVTDSMIREAFLANGFTIKDGHSDLKPYVYAAARAILALRPVQVPMTDELFDLICNAIDKADTITMEGDYMLDSDDCIAVVRVMQALLSVHHGITAQAKKETP